MSDPTNELDPKVASVRRYIRGCNGSQNMHTHWTRRLIYSDGVLHVAAECGAHWLVDVVASYQTQPKVKAEPFQAWTLEHRPATDDWLVTATDGDNNRLAMQVVPYSDFPIGLSPFVLFLEGGTLMLPAER